MPLLKPTIAEWIQRADPTHPDSEALGYDTGGSTIS